MKHWYEKEKARQRRVRVRFGEDAPEEEVTVDDLRAEENGALPLERGFGVSRAVVRVVDEKARVVELSCRHRRNYRSRKNPPQWMACPNCTERVREAMRKKRIEQILAGGKKP